MTIYKSKWVPPDAGPYFITKDLAAEWERLGIIEEIALPHTHDDYGVGVVIPPEASHFHRMFPREGYWQPTPGEWGSPLEQTMKYFRQLTPEQCEQERLRNDDVIKWAMENIFYDQTEIHDANRPEDGMTEVAETTDVVEQNTNTYGGVVTVIGTTDSQVVCANDVKGHWSEEQAKVPGGRNIAPNVFMMDKYYWEIIGKPDKIVLRFCNEAGEDKIAREKDELENLREAMRWIAVGKTGSYGTADAFASAVLSGEEDDLRFKGEG